MPLLSTVIVEFLDNSATLLLVNWHETIPVSLNKEGFLSGGKQYIEAYMNINHQFTTVKNSTRGT